MIDGIEKMIRYPHFGNGNRAVMLCWWEFGGLKYEVDKLMIND